MKILIPIIVGIFSSYLVAAETYDTGAMRTASKLCMSCHGTPFYQAKQLEDIDWEDYFNIPGKMEEVHKEEDRKVFNTSRYKKNKKKMLRFYIQFSKYAGAVHGCDANSCGVK